MAAVDQLEEQIRMAVRVGQIADLINHQQIRRRIATQPVTQRRITVQAGQIAEQLSCRGEQHRMPLQDGLIRDVLGNHGLAQATGADQDRIGRGGQEVQRHQLRNCALITLLRPGPIEVGQGLEAPDMRAAQPSLQRAAGAFGFLPGQ